MIRRVPLIVWFIIPTIILVAGGVWFFSRNASVLGEATDKGKPVAVANPLEGVEEFAIVSQEHIATGKAGSGYNSNPPTSGPHWQGPAKNGIYDSALADEQLIHNLEHGYVWISYRVENSDLTATATQSAGLKAEEIDKLKEIVKDDDWKIVLAPRAANDSKIALVAWGRLLKLDEINEQKVKEFIRTYRNRGPEQTPE
ncbi:DUF3105 domain-containing protein [Candidatus Curtissbacteria bacterium]|nr:DUF3105 domain-containing protein [Candidatus Curtissbacteria bacterium]